MLCIKPRRSSGSVARLNQLTQPASRGVIDEPPVPMARARSCATLARTREADSVASRTATLRSATLRSGSAMVAEVSATPDGGVGDGGGVSAGGASAMAPPRKSPNRTPSILTRAKNVVKATSMFRGMKKEALAKRTQDMIQKMTIEELYCEVLYYLLHNVGCDVGTSADRDDLCRLLQDAFKVDDDKHQQLMDQVQAKEAPKIVLNVEVMEGQDLKPKDANGLCDPFCTLYLASNSTHRYNTSVKQQTLCPSWEEHFSLPVQNPSEDILMVEAWDFDPAETVQEKMTKLTDVKGVKGLRKLIKEIAVTASTGKHDNEFIGTAQVALNCIPTAGQTMWVNLERKNKARKQGVIKLRMAFSAEKNTQVARQEHRHLLRLMLLHQLDCAKPESYQWSGEFSEHATTIIRQHAVQSGLCPNDEYMAQWIEFSAVHTDHPLSFTVFANLANKLQKAFAAGQLSSEEKKQFWEAAKRLLPSCMNIVRALRKRSNNDRGSLNQLTAILNTISTLASLELPEDIDVFPPSVYGWLTLSEDKPCNVQSVLQDAVKQGAEDWMNYVLENNTPDGPSDEDRLRHLIKLVQLVRTDLTKAIEYHDKIFHKSLHLPYSKLLFRVYEAKTCELVHPVVEDVCDKLRPLRFNDTMAEGTYEKEEPVLMGTTLFELYLALQRLSVLGNDLCPDEYESLVLAQFHAWFHRGVAQWLDIALYKALQRVEKAVELDSLVPVDSSVKYSSSAVDTFAIFYQIKVFWQQLAWPDVEGSYSFVAKIIDDICRCSVFYADKMSHKVDGMGETDSGTVHQSKFQVTQEWCLAINNIDYVRQSIQPFVGELEMDKIITSLAEFRSASAAAHCKETLQQIVNNAVDTVSNKIIDLLETVANKMTPAISRFLQEGAELLNQESYSVDRLMLYLDENLVTLHSQLNSDNFDRILSIMWENVSNVLVALVQSSLEKRRPPSFFANLHETLNILTGFFRQESLQQQLQEQQRKEAVEGIIEVGVDDTDMPGDKHKKLRRIERILRLHGMETPELTHQFHVQRLLEQRHLQKNGDLPYSGLLTVRAQFVEDKLRVEIMNARNIKPMDSNGSCDPYVKIHLLPEEKFMGIPKPRTKTHKKNLFPLFDEIFTIPITPEQRNVKDGMMAFIVKDQDFLGNEFIAEAYLSFDEIPENDVTTGLETLPQNHLKLNRPQHVIDSDVMKALEHRQGDKMARDFVKRQKAKINEGKQQNGTK